MFASLALTAFARLLVANGSAPPVLDPDDAVLFVRATGTCPIDAGVDAPLDGGSGSGMPLDAGAQPDASTVPDAGALPDAGAGDAGTVPTLCGDAVMMVVQPKFQIDTSGSQFALLYVTPGPPATRLESSTTFEDLAAQTAPFVHQVEVDVPDPALGTQCASSGCISAPRAQQSSGGCGGGGATWSPPTLDGGIDPGALETVGPYEVAHVQAASRSEVAAWLDGLGYQYLPADLDAVEPYLALGWTVVAVRVSSTRAVDGALEPLSMTWSGSEIRVPIGLAHEAVPQVSSLTVYIAAGDSIELPGAHVSFAGRIGTTNVGYVTRNELSYDHTAGADADPIAVLQNADIDTRDEITVTNEVHVPVSRDCNDDGCLCSSRRGGPSADAPWYLAAIVLVLRPRRRRSVTKR